MLSLSGLLFLQLFIVFLTISVDFLFVSLVTNRVSLEDVCLPSFDVLSLAASCLDDKNELQLMVMATFSASCFALPSIPLMVLHSLVTSVFWSRSQQHSLMFAFCVCRLRFWILYSVLAVHARCDLFYGGHLVFSSHLIYLLV